MSPADEYRVVARNTATASTNKIHDDTVARRYGFAGGLVPGVDVYAYMTHPPVTAWGVDWLERGWMRARFATPVYEGEEVVVAPAAVDGGDAARGMGLELRGPDGPDGGPRATGEARLPDLSPPPPSPDHWGDATPRPDPPPASPATLAPGTALALDPRRFDADRADEYLADIGETSPLYTDQGVAHPGWLLRHANWVLSSNVRLGPWIHVESVTQHHALVRHGDSVEARATVTREWERKGHRFIELYVGLVANASRLIARIVHTAIYQPRPAAGGA